MRAPLPLMIDVRVRLVALVPLAAVVVLLGGCGGGAHAGLRGASSTSDAPASVHSGRRGSGPGPSGAVRSARRARASARTRAWLAREDAAIDRQLRRDPFIVSGGSQRRDIALTFDDGPGPYTPRVLAVLRRFHVPATFFEIGESMTVFGANTRAEAAAGYPIEDHTETHPNLAALPLAAQRGQVLDQTRHLANLGVAFPRLFRPPYGSFSRPIFSILRPLRMLMVLWTIDTNDWQRPGVQAILRAAIGGARPGAIILMHDGGGNRSQTIAALPTIIRALRRRHYRLVTVPQLLIGDPQLRHLPIPNGLSGS